MSAAATPPRPASSPATSRKRTRTPTARYRDAATPEELLPAAGAAAAAAGSAGSASKRARAASFGPAGAALRSALQRADPRPRWVAGTTESVTLLTLRALQKHGRLTLDELVLQTESPEATVRAVTHVLRSMRIVGVLVRPRRPPLYTYRAGLPLALPVDLDVLARRLAREEELLAACRKRVNTWRSHLANGASARSTLESLQGYQARQAGTRQDPLLKMVAGHLQGATSGRGASPRGR